MKVVSYSAHQCPGNYELEAAAFVESSVWVLGGLDVFAVGDASSLLRTLLFCPFLMRTDTHYDLV
eukprot:6118406-Amphidinium_carterae.1